MTAIVPRTRWGRLLSEEDAAEYLGIGTTMLRGLNLKVRRLGRRILYDIRDLDLWVDRMDEQPVADADLARAAADEEARFFERRRARARA
ncbi:DNA-binding protein [Sphingomonas sp. ABOLF]|uniref:DNA-binding protein n=1 Tax=Sphingomonas sp. ABOLF TaxID=1985879 RepID=UPI000F7E5CCB|nr:DNA-binding protein [Sphingomonas sp. ABOLF]RSV15642.1 DNA-binding protein [Sphingomonas sp. ABOLF]